MVTCPCGSSIQKDLRCCSICDYSEEIEPEIDKHIGKRLNQDFLFYLDFTRNFQMRFSLPDDVKICQVIKCIVKAEDGYVASLGTSSADPSCVPPVELVFRARSLVACPEYLLWLDKLCGKRSCNCSSAELLNLYRYLVQLVACMQAGKRSGVFLKPPKDGELEEYPDPPVGNVEKPEWLQNIIGDSHKAKDARTYLATRKLEDGRGAFAYVALTLKDGEDQWISPSGRAKLKTALKDGFEYALGDLETPDLATVLASRKTVEQREGVVAFYKHLLKSIETQLQGNFSEGTSEAINDLLVRLVKGLKSEGKYKPIQSMPRREALFVLLQMLELKIKRRITRIERRELLLDEVERQLISQSMLSETILENDKYTGVPWKSHISQDIALTYHLVLKYTYPPELVQFCVIKIQEEMHSIGDRSKRRHEAMVSQLRADMAKEQRLGKHTCDDLNAEISDLRTALNICQTDASAHVNVWSTENKLLENEIAQEQAVFETLHGREEHLLQKIDAGANAANIQ